MTGVVYPLAPAVATTRPRPADAVTVATGGYCPSMPRSARTRRHRALAPAIVLAAVLALLAYMALEARDLTVNRVEFASPELPLALDGLTVALVTDVHHGPFLSRARVRDAVDRVNALEPDVIVLGGDYVHRDAKYIAPVFAELARLRAPLGVYGVLGNHDHWEGATATRRAMSAAGITLIENAGVWLEAEGARLRLGGVGNLWEGEQRLGGAVGDAGADDFVLLVSHNPDYVEALTEGTVDLVLAGHTHGGQVRFVGAGAPWVPSEFGQRYRSGLVTKGPVPVLVSNGVGTVSPPLRFLAPAQIVLLTLRSGAPD